MSKARKWTGIVKVLDLEGLVSYSSWCSDLSTPSTSTNHIDVLAPKRASMYNLYKEEML